MVGTAFGRYGGVWAQDEARRAAGIASGKVLAEATLSIPSSVTRFAETHPADDPEVATALIEVIDQLAGQTVPAAA